MLNQNDPLKDQNNQSDSKTPLKNKSSLLDETKKKFQTKAWFIDASQQHRSHDFIISIPSDLLKEKKINEGDALILAQKDPKNPSSFTVNEIARVFRKRYTLKNTLLYFDGLHKISPKSDKMDELIRSISAIESIVQLDWDLFEETLKQTSSFSWSEFPLLAIDSRHAQAYLRELMLLAIKDDLLGPAKGPEEELNSVSPRERYILGKLSPKDYFQEENNLEIEDKIDINNQNTSENEDQEDKDKDQKNESYTQAENEDYKEEDISKLKDLAAITDLTPSSLGFTFCVDAQVDKIELTARWGYYTKLKDTYIYKRTPCEGKLIISMDQEKIQPRPPVEKYKDILIKGSVSAPLKNGDRLVSLFLINNQTDMQKDTGWIFQPELIVRDLKNRAIFRKRAVHPSDHLFQEIEEKELEMIYRKQVEFAVGHGVSVHARTKENDSQHAVEIRTVIIPESEVPVTETPGLDPEDRPGMKNLIEKGFLDMEKLAKLNKDELIAGLKLLTQDYALWINEQKERIGKDLIGYDEIAAKTIQSCNNILKGIDEGIEILNKSEEALEAFRFANKAMALQRIRSIYGSEKRRNEKLRVKDIESKINIPKNRSWRAFQIAFILLSLPSLADPTHKDRSNGEESYADLLWFPTGGGKTEAYLGLAAFAMGIRRLQGNLGGLDSSRGLTVIMRYTLRLLTLQQFQRASTLICALEVLRQKDEKKWGTSPFTIGFWVGNRVTPDTSNEALNIIRSIREKRYYNSNSPHQLGYCPWCSSEINEERNIEVNKDIQRTIIYCPNYSCEFSQRSRDMGIPILVVDDEIYRHPPSILIGTVDKFAMMAWRGQVRTLFGIVNKECRRHGLLWAESSCKGEHNKTQDLPKVTVKNISKIRPPDLIIQDEFHLISGPLGTIVGLYETAIDELCKWEINGKSIRPKIVASTATVRKAAAQINNIFLRKLRIFPPNGLDIEDNFFSVQRSIKDKPGRRYIGICSLGSSRPAVLIRVYVAMLSASQAIFNRFGKPADPYMTLVGYFNSLRELGGMKRLAEDDVKSRVSSIKRTMPIHRPGLNNRFIHQIDELTSRISNKDIPKKLAHLELKFNPVLSTNGNFYKDRKDKEWPIDIILATNMLSVGVDVSRLGLMAVNNQPKNTAEYIQATSRVGRSFPGLICMVFAWTRPRDISHYESFEHYHSSFYKHVEAQSVTPFSSRALDRGLSGVLIGLIRLLKDRFNSNILPEDFSKEDPDFKAIRDIILNRAWKVTNNSELKDKIKEMLHERADIWASKIKEAQGRQNLLGYKGKKSAKSSSVLGLLKQPGTSEWQEFTVPISMREVEPNIKLILDPLYYVNNEEEEKPWRSPSKKEKIKEEKKNGEKK